MAAAVLTLACAGSVAAVTAAPAAGAVTAPASARAVTAASPVTASTADGLIARLAVLRRPQTPADVLPAGVALPRPHGAVVAGLTRLVAVLPQARLYLVVTAPAGGPLALWSPGLGDQATIAAVVSDGSVAGEPFPAADLNDPFHLNQIDIRASPQGPATIYEAAIVPDGVAQVRWRVRHIRSGTSGPAQEIAVSNNLAVLPLPPTDLPGPATWYAADGSVVPTSDRALRSTLAHRQALARRQLIRSIARHPHRAAPALLADFAVFSVTSRSPAREPGGLRVWRPRLTQLPMIVLIMLSSPHPAMGLDYRQVRAITTRSGAHLWVVPGTHGLCLDNEEAVRGPAGVRGTSGGGSCSPNLAEAEAQGAGFSECCTNGVGTSYGVLPLSKPTVTLRINGRRRTIRPPFGVYAVATSRHRSRRPTTVSVSPAPQSVIQKG